MRLVLGFSPGSASDQVARLIVPALASALGRDIRIELEPGSNGADAACEVATARADGETLFMATLGTHALAPHLEENLPYDPLHHFAPVALVATAPLLLACHPSLPVSNVSDLVKVGRREPRTISYGTSAIGGAPHLAAELFQHMTGIEMRHARFDHTDRLYEDLEAGHIAVSFNNMMSMLPRCESKTLRALGVTSARRSAAAEEIPTIAESGLPGYEVSNWLGIVAPRRTPAPVVAELNAAVGKALANATIVETFRAAGVTPCGGSPQAFFDFITREIGRWGPIVARFHEVR